MLNAIRFYVTSSVLLVATIATRMSGSDFKYVSIKTEHGPLKFQCTNEALKRFGVFKNMLEEGCNGEEIALNYDEKQITPHTVRMLLLQAEDLT